VDPLPVPDAGFSPGFIAELTSEPADGDGGPEDDGPDEAEPVGPSRLEEALDEAPFAPGVPGAPRTPDTDPGGWQPRVIRPERVGGTES
jgi:hypothetical protein